MRILIVEDERPTAEDIKLLVEQILNKEITSIHIETTLDSKSVIDTIVISANINKQL
jgi:ABC-type Zn uptake system ZnuABC Zn-binding protein ZnuA